MRAMTISTMLQSLRMSPIRLGLILIISCITLIILYIDVLLPRIKSVIYLINNKFDASLIKSLVETLEPPPLTKLPTRTGWTFRSTPDFCKRIVENPLEFNKCARDVDTQVCTDGKMKGKVLMMSQYSQDYYVYTQHFSRLKRRGVYLDIAANHPTFISNTYFMDACLGWDGMCVEANPKYFEKIKKYRSCKLIDTCVSDKEGEKVTFILGGGLGGISDTNKNLKTWLKNKKTGSIELTCTTMAKVLKDANVTVIDYLSLDVEGHELKVLEGFDWGSIKINLITVEGTKQGLSKIGDLLKGKGYVRHIPMLNAKTVASGVLSEDAVFLHKSVTFGDPK